MADQHRTAGGGNAESEVGGVRAARELKVFDEWSRGGEIANEGKNLRTFFPASPEAGYQADDRAGLEGSDGDADAGLRPEAALDEHQ